MILALFVSGTVEAKKKKYPNGDYYEGEMKKGKPDGLGKMIYINGDVYEGYWSNGSLRRGKMSYANGDVYEGGWLLGEFNDGKMIYANGDIFEGSWLAGELQEGKMSYANGNIYKGSWKQNKMDKGVLICKDGRIYEGIWNKGSFNGTGKWEKDNLILSFNGIISKTSQNMNGNLAYIESTSKKQIAHYVGDLDSYKRNGIGQLVLPQYNITIDGKWNEDILIAGRGQLEYDNEKVSFHIEVNDMKKHIITIQNGTSNNTIVTTLSFLTLEQLPKQLFKGNIQQEIQRRKQQKQEEQERQRMQQEQEFRKQRSAFIVQKSKNFNIQNYLWSVPELNNLEEENIAKFNQVLRNGEILIYGTITDFLTGEGDNTALAYWSNGLLPSTYTQYFIKLRGGLIIRATREVIANLNKGETIFAITELRKDDYRGYIFNAIYQTVTTSLQEMNKELCSPIGDSVQPKLKYETINLIKNIYR